jgi:hypothetical protein
MRQRTPTASLVGVTLCLCALSPPRIWAAEHGREPRGSLRIDPPRLVSLDLAPLGQHAVRAAVQYAPDPRLGAELTLNLTNGPVTFKRRQDGQYVAVLELTDQQIAALAERDRRTARLQSTAIHNVYDGRVLIGSTIAAPLYLYSMQTREAGDNELLAKSVPQAYMAVGGLVPDPKSVLMITDRKVVGDTTRTWDPCDAASHPNSGPWTFGHLITSLPGVTDPAKLAEKWLGTWKVKQTVGTGIEVPDRPRIADVLSHWPRVAGALDLDQAPFRLLAIVNRVDLAENLMFPGGATPTAPGSAGELRFVFDVTPIQDTGAGKQCAIMRFQVIFEYRVTASTCDDAKHWAQRWIDLGGLGLGTPAYNAALEGITEDIVVNGKGELAQVRTDEIDLADSIGKPTFWEMREFALLGSGASLSLSERPVRRTPPDTLNHEEALATLVNSKASDILQNVYEFSGADAGANPQMDDTTFWDGKRGSASVQITDPAVRFNFSLNTCTGCHARETCTHFSHVIQNGAGQEATLSAFLEGGQNVPDPVFCPARECTAAPASYCTQSPPPTIETPLAISTPGTPSATPTLGTAMTTETPEATATVDPCCYEPNDLARRRQVLDQLTLCDFPNGYVPLNAAH